MEGLTLHHIVFNQNFFNALDIALVASYGYSDSVGAFVHFQVTYATAYVRYHIIDQMQ